MSGYGRVLFLSLAKVSDFYFTELPVGLGYLEESVEQAGVETDVIDMNLGLTMSDLVARVESFRPDLVAAQMYSVGYRESYRAFEALKNRFPGLTIVVGGAHPSLFHQQVLEECPALDFAVQGEGEKALVQLCTGVPAEEIAGLAYRREGRVTVNPRPAFVADLDSLPFPRFRKFPLERFARHTVNKTLKISLCTSRGCPFLCTYCASGTIMGKRYRFRSIAGVLEEVEYWYGRGLRHFSFVDDGFTCRRERVHEFCDGLEKRKLQGLRLSLDNGIRADQVNRELLGRMREVGFWRAGIGVEGGNQKVLDLLKKGEKMGKIRQAIQDLCDLQYNVMLYFLVGSPGETMEDLEDSFRLALEFPVDAAAFNNIIPYPHTALFDDLDRRGLLLKRPEEYLTADPRHCNEPVFETPEIPRALRPQALARAFAVEREVARRSMRRKTRRLGIAGRVFSYFYGFPEVRSRVMSNGLFRRLILEPAKKRMDRPY